MDTKPLVLVTGTVPPDRDPDRLEWTKPCGEDLVLFKLRDLSDSLPEVTKALAQADRLFILPSPDISGELFHFLAGWGLARPGQAFWLDKSGSVPLPGPVSCPDRETLEREIFLWRQEKVSRDASRELRNRGFWSTPDYFLKTVASGNEEAVRLFIQAGISPDLTDDNGIPALCLAARAGHTDICRYLLEKGCNKNATAPDRNNNALMDAAAEGNTTLVKLLVSAGTELNVQSKNDQTALMLAVGINNPAIVAILLDAGADTTLKDVLGMTAYQYGKILGFGQIVSLFEKKGINS